MEQEEKKMKSDLWVGFDGTPTYEKLYPLAALPALGRFGDVGDYKPSNCKWMTPAEQGRNRRTKCSQKNLYSFQS